MFSFFFEYYNHLEKSSDFFSSHKNQNQRGCSARECSTKLGGQVDFEVALKKVKDGRCTVWYQEQ